MSKKPPADSPAGLLMLALDGRSREPEAVAERIDAINRVRARLDEEEQQLAFGLRLRGHSWQTIADLWGLNSRQRAQQKFAGAELLDRLESLSRTLLDCGGCAKGYHDECEKTTNPCPPDYAYSCCCGARTWSQDPDDEQ